MFFFFNDTATTEIYTLSLHDALPILRRAGLARDDPPAVARRAERAAERRLARELGEREGAVPAWRHDEVLPVRRADRKSTRLNSSHANISYAVFCLKKKKILEQTRTR